MKAHFLALAIAATGTVAEAATYTFKFEKTSGDWPFAASLYGIDVAGAEFTIDVPTLKNLSIEADATVESLSAPIISTSIGMGPFDPDDFGISLRTNRHGRIENISFGGGYASIFYFYIGLNSVSGSYEDFDPKLGYYVNVFEEAPGFWSINGEPAVVPLPSSAPMLLAGAACLFGLRRRAAKKLAKLG